ncbi:hypothetical protein HHX25_18975 [Flavivirga sp. Y03]|uniref:Integrase n=1 Tax=Flavivirga algicola TaxID=2729136 RepID=A0ABX1S3Y1_9FLAO|nr:hypothetical protein [Flavivirga algicola]
MPWKPTTMGKTPHFDYDLNYKVLKVTQNGVIRWKSYYWVCLTSTLKGNM